MLKIPKKFSRYFGVDISKKSLEDFRLRFREIKNKNEMKIGHFKSFNVIKDDLRECKESAYIINSIITDNLKRDNDDYHLKNKSFLVNNYKQILA